MSAPRMNCDICHRSYHPQKLPFLCPIDARNLLYEGRIANARALIENEVLEQQINSLLLDQKSSSDDVVAAKTVRLQGLKSEETQAADRTSQIIAQADRLRAEVEAAKRDIEERKKKITRRKEDMTVVSKGIEARRERQTEETVKTIQRTKYRWNRDFENTALTRGFLCMESARLYGLRRVKKAGSVKYELGGIDIPELRGMISMSLFSA